MQLPLAIVSVVVASWLAGSVEALVVCWAGPGRGTAAGSSVLQDLAAAGLAGSLSVVPGLLLGVGLWLGLAAGRRLRHLRETARLVRSWLAPAPNADRAMVVRVHAIGLAVVLALAGFVAVTRWLLGRLWTLQATDLALTLAIAGSAVAAAMAAGLGAWLACWLQRPIAALDRRWALPRPAEPAWRFVLFVLLPVVAVLGPFLRAEHHWLGPLGTALGGAMVLVVAGAIALLWQRYGPRAERRRRRASWAVAALALLALGATVVAYEQRSSWARQAEHGFGGGLGAALLRQVTDVDGDGASSLLGGRDCAPFDAARGPLRPETPGNGVDEDCDGADGHGAAVPAQTWHGELSRESIRRYNILWLVPDGVRADHVGALGYPRATTPSIDALAKEAWLFRQAFSQSSATAYSFASMLTGLYPATMTWDADRETPQPVEGHRAIAERLRERGYRTAFFLNRWTKDVYPSLLRGYDQAVTPRQTANWKHWSQQTSPMVTAQVIEFIEGAVQAKAPFFATVYYSDPHYPYVSHPDTPRFGARQIDRYDGELAWVDHHIGSLLSYLRYRWPLWERTVVVVTADHGEEFGDHQHEHHARSCYAESTHVPLVLRVPGQPAKIVDEPVALVDIAPALLELTGAADGAEGLHGQSLLLPALAPERLAGDRPIFCTVTSQFRAAERFYRRSVRAGRFALMQDVLRGDLELYDTEADPTEQRDLAAEPAHADTLAVLQELLAQSRTGNLSARY